MDGVPAGWRTAVRDRTYERASAHAAFAFPVLPPHWAMTLHVRGEAKPNTIEIKFIDSSGLNVWWMRRVALPITREWQELRFRPSDLSFAWGPLGKGPPRAIAAIEIAVTAASGGNGWIALDALAMVPLPVPVADRVRPRISATTSAIGHGPASMLPRDFAVAPRNARGHGSGTHGWRSRADGAVLVVGAGIPLAWRGVRVVISGVQAPGGIEARRHGSRARDRGVPVAIVEFRYWCERAYWSSASPLVRMTSL